MKKEFLVKNISVLLMFVLISLFSFRLNAEVAVDKVLVTYDKSGNSKNLSLTFLGNIPNLCISNVNLEYAYKDGNLLVKVVPIQLDDKIQNGDKNNLFAPVSYCALSVRPYIEVLNIDIPNEGIDELVINPGTSSEQRKVLDIRSNIDSTKTDVSDEKNIDVDKLSFSKIDKIESEKSNLEIEGGLITGVFEKSFDGNQLYFSGYRVSECYEIAEISYEEIDNDIYLLTYDIVKNYNFCPKKISPYKKEILLPSTIL